MSYLKWDHNRDLLDAAGASTRHVVVHDNVAAGQRPVTSGLAEAALAGTPLEFTGTSLANVGIQAPVLFPEQSILIELHATGKLGPTDRD